MRTSRRARAGAVRESTLRASAEATTNPRPSTVHIHRLWKADSGTSADASPVQDTNNMPSSTADRKLSEQGGGVSTAVECDGTSHNQDRHYTSRARSGKSTDSTDLSPQSSTLTMIDVHGAQKREAFDSPEIAPGVSQDTRSRPDAPSVPGVVERSPIHGTAHTSPNNSKQSTTPTRSTQTAHKASSEARISNRPNTKASKQKAASHEFDEVRAFANFKKRVLNAFPSISPPRVRRFLGLRVSAKLWLTYMEHAGHDGMQTIPNLHQLVYDHLLVMAPRIQAQHGLPRRDQDHTLQIFPLSDDNQELSGTGATMPTDEWTDDTAVQGAEPHAARTTSTVISTDQEGVSAKPMQTNPLSLMWAASVLVPTETGRSTQDKEPDLSPTTPSEARSNEPDLHTQPDDTPVQAAEPHAASTTSTMISIDGDGVSAETMQTSPLPLVGAAVELDTMKTGRSTQDKQPLWSPHIGGNLNLTQRVHSDSRYASQGSWPSHITVKGGDLLSLFHGHQDDFVQEIKQAERPSPHKAFSLPHGDTVSIVEHLRGHSKWTDQRNKLGCPPSFARLSPHPPWKTAPPPWWCRPTGRLPTRD